MATVVDVEIEDAAWADDLADPSSTVERAVLAVLDAQTPGSAEAGDVVVLLTDDEAVRDLNDRFRDRDRPTNVLSFPAPAMPDTGEGAARPLGDIVLAHGVCVREAAEQGKSLENHLTHLVVHGVLHLLGRDHEIEAEAEAMEAEERSILAGLGVSDPYDRPHDA